MVHPGVLAQAAYHGAPAYRAEVTAALAGESGRGWLALDRREAGLPWRWDAGDAVRRADAAAYVAAAPSPLAVTLAALDANGFVREAALGRLRAVDERLALPALALRCADPVGPVRDRARTLAADRLRRDAVTAVPLLAPVAYAVRDRLHGGWLAGLLDGAIAGGSAAMAEAALATADRDARRATYQLLADRLPIERLVAAATREPDPYLRRLAGTAVVDRARAAGDVDVLRRFVRAGSATLRGAAVWELAEAGDLGPARNALADRAASVRAVAQAALRRAGADPAGEYRRLIAAAPRPPVVAGLGETGGPDDAALLRPLLTGTPDAVRAAAVRALRWLGGSDPAAFTGLLTDASPAVVREAAAALRGAPLDPALPRRLLGRDQPEHVRRAAYRLARTAGTYDRLLAGLVLLADPADPLAGRAWADLRNWLLRDAATAYTRPSGAMAEAIDAALRDAVLDPGDERMLRFHLGLR